MIFFFITLGISVLFVRWSYLGMKITTMHLDMAKYGSFMYVKLSTEAYRELVTQDSIERFEDSLFDLGAIDESSKRVTEAIQKDLIPVNKLILKKFFSWKITYEELYPKNSLAQEFIPEKFPSFWVEKAYLQLDGFYAGILAARVGEFERFESILRKQIGEGL